MLATLVERNARAISAAVNPSTGAKGQRKLRLPRKGRVAARIQLLIQLQQDREVPINLSHEPVSFASERRDTPHSPR